MIFDLGQIFEELENMGYCPDCGEFEDDCSCTGRFEHNQTEETENEKRIRNEIGGTISYDIS